MNRKTKEGLSNYKIDKLRYGPETVNATLRKIYYIKSRAGNRMTYDFFRKITGEVGLAAGIKFHPHMARHTYATMLLRKGVSVVHVSQLLGHEDLSSTSVYLHPTQAEAIEEARRAIEGTAKGEQGSVSCGTVQYGPVGN